MEQTAEGTALSPFRHRDFTLYQSARVVLILAGQLVIVGLQLQVLQLTNSAFHLGMIGLAQVLPNLLASLPAGHIADRVNRRTIITTCALVNAATVGWLAWESAQPQPSLVAIYIACGLFGLIRAFSAPAGHAFLPALVPGSLLNRAIVIHLTVFNLATVVGPAGGGFLYGERNALRVYATATVLFVVAYLLMVLIRTRPAPAQGAEPFERAFTAGVRYVWNDKRLLGAMSLDLFAVLMGGATALLPVVAQNILHSGPTEYGFLRSATSIGAGLAAIVLATRPIRSHIGSWLLHGVAFYGLATIGFGFSTSFPLSMALLIIAGAADMLSVTVRHTLIQVTTPDAMRGRVSAVSMIFINCSNEMGEFRAGTMAHYVGTARAIVLGGVGTVVVVLAWMGLFPSLRKADRFEDKATIDS